MNAQYDVAGIGNAIVDVIFPASDQFLLDHKIAKSVMTLIDEYRAATLLAAAGQGTQTSGGSVANTMAGIASFGGKGLYTGKVKNDSLGKVFAQDMKTIGVHFDTPMARESLPTACCIIAVTPDGHRSMNTYLGACRELNPDDIDPHAIASAAILYIEGYLWDGEEPKAAIRKAITAAKDAGRKVAFTLSDPFCVGRYRDEFLHLMRQDIDILFANEEEAKALFQVETFAEALKEAQDWKGLAALTRSEKGCVIADAKGNVVVQEAEKVKKVIDTTGAGDQFAAGFLHGYAQGKNLGVCARLGVIAAAEIISHYGARPETPFKTLAKNAGL